MYKFKIMLPNGKWKNVSFKNRQTAINEIEKYMIYLENVICDIDTEIINDNCDNDYDIVICKERK